MNERQRKEMERVGRVADRAVCTADVAESFLELVNVILKASEGASARELRQRLERTLGELVAKYQREEKKAVDEFVSLIQAKLSRELEQ